MKESYTREEIEKLLELPCCHISGTHDPSHFAERKGICDRQMREAYICICSELDINPTVKSKSDCGWCKGYAEERKGDGLRFRDAPNIKRLLSNVADKE